MVWKTTKLKDVIHFEYAIIHKIGTPQFKDKFLAMTFSVVTKLHDEIDADLLFYITEL